MMGPAMTSALAKRLRSYLDLTTTEIDTLDLLERQRRPVAAGEVLMREGELTDRLVIIVDGWMHSSLTLPDGSRQILQLHFPGDLVGLSTLAWGMSGNTLTAVSTCTVATFPQEELTQLFRTLPRLAALFYTIAAAEQVSFSDRLASLGQTDARARIANLFLDIISRLRIGMPEAVTGGRFELPVTQSDIGAATGLTKVHVNRTLRRMEEEALIEREGRSVVLIDEKALVRIAGFRDRLRHIATEWLPSPTPRQSPPLMEVVAAR